MGDADPKLSQVFYLPCCFLQQGAEEGDHHGHDWQDQADAPPRQEDEEADIERDGAIEEHGVQEVQPVEPKYRREAVKATKLSAYEAELKQALKADAKRVKKERRTASHCPRRWRPSCK